MSENSRSRAAKRIVILVAVVACLAGGGYLVWHTAKVIAVASAFYAKTLCSSVFVSGRDEDIAVREDVLADMKVGLRHWDATVRRERGLVEASLYGWIKRKALYRPGLGCTLVLDTTADALQRQAAGYTAPAPAKLPNDLWPAGARVEPYQAAGQFDEHKLRAAVEEAFSEPRPNRALRRTQAVVVVHKGRIVAERYADGITPDMPRPGWSMGKTMMGALIGILVKENMLSRETSSLFPEWRGEGDERKTITVEHLLRMTSGLDFDAPHARMLSDVRTMLFLKGDSAAYAKSEELVDPVGSIFFYASGSTTLLASVMRGAVAGGQAAYFSYPWRALFEPLGMTSAVLEPDAAGTFLAPAFVHASARDWARLGLFYLQDGVWRGKRLLPHGWVAKQRTATKQSGGEYGAHLWVRIPAFLRPSFANAYRLPDDAFFMLGHDGQMVAMFPSQDLAVVRLGLSRRRNAWDHEAFLYRVLEAFR